MGPLPSSGSPKALTTLPTKASPTGTSRIFPVVWQASPSFSLVQLPKIMTPTPSSSRFNASTVTLLGRETSSDDPTSEYGFGLPSGGRACFNKPSLNLICCLPCGRHFAATRGSDVPHLPISALHNGACRP